jgi:hypothetical protein
VVLLSGLAGGFALGVLARAWMRAISEDPDFTWEGTGFIVVGFTLFGLAQSAAAAGRQRHVRRGALTALRVLGGIFMLPLFGAAGALMAPTVIGGSLARFRVDWRPVARMLCAVVAAAPVAFVTVDLVRTFAISMQTIVGIAGLLGVYATVIQMAGATLAPAPNPQRLSRRARWAIGATLLALFLVPLVVGGVK